MGTPITISNESVPQLHHSDVGQSGSMQQNSRQTPQQITRGPPHSGRDISSSSQQIPGGNSYNPNGLQQQSPGPMQRQMSMKHHKKGYITNH